MHMDRSIKMVRLDLASAYEQKKKPLPNGKGVIALGGDPALAAGEIY